MPADTEDPRTDESSPSALERDPHYHPQEDPEDLEGGPVKSFLEHLEDLRWVLIKSSVAIGLGMLLCLIGADHVVALLRKPLAKGTTSYPGTNHVVSVFFDTNRLGVYHFSDDQQKRLPLGTNRYQAYQIELVPAGSNLVFALHPKLDIDPEVAALQQPKLNTMGPVSGFFIALQVALYGGIALASPFVFYFVASFIFPALRLKERYYIYRGLGFGFTLFVIGVCFCYFVLLPVALRASVAYPNWMGLDADLWRAEDYMNFVCKFMLGMGIGFQMPVVLLTLVKIGVLNYQRLAMMRKYMIVINLVLGAVLTTPEVITQILMAVPLQLLYEISVWIAWWWERDERKAAKLRNKA